MLRGMAILAIAMHNFCHYNGVGENEFAFSTDNINLLFENLGGNLPDALWALLSFFGHYGVEVFVFLSGYGLARKHACGLPSFGTYMRHNLLKIWRLMIPGLVCFALIDIAFWGHPLHVARLCAQSLFFLPHINHVYLDEIDMGPYWFFGLILELYIFYYLVAHRSGNGKLLLWSLICLAAEGVAIAFAGADSDLLIQLRLNLFTAIPVFCLGICLGRSEIDLRGRTVHALGASMLLLAVTLSVVPHPAAWLLSSLPWPLAMLWAALLLPASAVRVLGGIGRLSAFIFVIHPLVRYAILCTTVTPKGWGWATLGLFLLASLLLAAGLRPVAMRLRGRRV